MDHGELNIPLSKRGNIDAQIDRFKAQQVSAERSNRIENAAVTKALRIEAKRLFAETGVARFQRLALVVGRPVAATKAQIKSNCHWDPRLAISLLTPRME